MDAGGVRRDAVHTAAGLPLADCPGPLYPSARLRGVRPRHARPPRRRADRTGYRLPSLRRRWR